MKAELIKHLDTLTITSENIGEVRRSLSLPFECEWNATVRDETAARENKKAQAAPLALIAAPGDILRLPMGLGFSVWKITGAHIGASGHEDLITLCRLDKHPGSAHGHEVSEYKVPSEILLTHPNLELIRK